MATKHEIEATFAEVQVVDDIAVIDGYRLQVSWRRNSPQAAC
ncbi:hypothetical protein [Nocardia sp. SSK8]